MRVGCLFAALQLLTLLTVAGGQPADAQERRGKAIRQKEFWERLIDTSTDRHLRLRNALTAWLKGTRLEPSTSKVLAWAEAQGLELSDLMIGMPGLDELITSQLNRRDVDVLVIRKRAKAMFGRVQGVEGDGFPDTDWEATDLGGLWFTKDQVPVLLTNEKVIYGGLQYEIRFGPLFEEDSFFIMDVSKHSVLFESEDGNAYTGVVHHDEDFDEESHIVFDDGDCWTRRNPFPRYPSVLVWYSNLTSEAFMDVPNTAFEYQGCFSVTSSMSGANYRSAVTVNTKAECSSFCNGFKYFALYAPDLVPEMGHLDMFDRGPLCGCGATTIRERQVPDEDCALCAQPGESSSPRFRCGRAQDQRMSVYEQAGQNYVGCFERLDALWSLITPVFDPTYSGMTTTIATSLQACALHCNRYRFFAFGNRVRESETELVDCACGFEVPHEKLDDTVCELCTDEAFGCGGPGDAMSVYRQVDEETFVGAWNRVAEKIHGTEPRPACELCKLVDGQSLENYGALDGSTVAGDYDAVGRYIGNVTCAKVQKDFLSVMGGVGCVNDVSTWRGSCCDRLEVPKLDEPKDVPRQTEPEEIEL